MSEPSRASASVPTLQFPRPQGNQRLANWISSSSPDIMAQAFFVDEDGTVDSYELINTDGELESQDGQTAGSTASSLDLLARLSDEESLSGMDHIHEYEAHDINRVPYAAQDHETPSDDEAQDDTEEDEEDDKSEQEITHPENWDQHEPSSIVTEKPREVHRGYLGGIIEAIPIKITNTDEPRGTKAAESITDYVRRSVTNPKSLHKIGVVLAVFASLLTFAIVHSIGAAVLQSANKACDQPLSGHLSGQVHPAMITSLVAKPPTTVTTTVTTTSTVLSPAFSTIAKTLTTSAEQVAKSVEKTFACATKFRSEVLDWGKAHGLTEETLMNARDGLKDRFTHYLRAAEDRANDLKLNVVKAQIKSKLIWLQMRKDEVEYHRYQMQARKYLKAKHLHMQLLQARARALREHGSTSSSRWGKSHLRHIFH